MIVSNSDQPDVDDERGSGSTRGDYFVILPWASSGPGVSCSNVSNLDLSRGILVELPSEPLRYEIEVDPTHESSRLDLYDAGHGHLLMSPRLVQCLEGVGVDNLQTFPAAVIHLPSRLTLPYLVANVVGLVRAAADPDDDLEDGAVEAAWAPEIDRKRVASLDLFRLYASFDAVVVSSRVKRALDSKSITGMVFRDTEEVTQQ